MSSPVALEGKRPQALPVVSADATSYLVDLAGRILRPAFTPAKRIDFDSVKGNQICARAGVLTCLRCGMSVIVAGTATTQVLQRMRCGRALQR